MVINSWDRQKGESEEEWILFRIYRDLGPGRRSFRKSYFIWRGVPEGSQIYHGGANAIATKNKWVERVLEYDRYMDKKTQAAVLLQRRQIAKEFGDRLREDARLHAEAARIALSKALRGIERLDESTASYGSAAQLLTASTQALKISNDIYLASMGLDDLLDQIEGKTEEDSSPEEPRTGDDESEGDFDGSDEDV